MKRSVARAVILSFVPTEEKAGWVEKAAVEAIKCCREAGVGAAEMTDLGLRWKGLPIYGKRWTREYRKWKGKGFRGVEI